MSALSLEGLKATGVSKQRIILHELKDEFEILLNI
jgi:hypothetical protein